MDTDSLSAGSNDSYTKESLQLLLCPKCNVKYPNIHELLTHQASEMHFACNQCKSCFWTEHGLQDHKRKSHRPDLDLECFGCHSHFDRAGRFWQHLESGECKVIFPSDIVRLRQKNLEFAEQLELRKLTMDDIMRREESYIKGDDTWASYSEGETAHTESVVTPDFPSRPAPIAIANAHPLHYRSEDFPALPIKPKVSTTPGFYGEQKRNVWSNRGAAVPRTNDIPTSYNSVPPPASYDILPVNGHNNSIPKPAPSSNIRVVQATANSTEEGSYSTTSSGRIIDPVNPNYNPAVFYNSVLEKFVCPYKSCSKKHNTAFALTRHLESPIHGGGCIPCIRCKKKFTTVATLITHMETTKNCPIRETEGFQRALGQITGGIMDFNTRSGMFVIDKSSVQELFDLRSQPLIRLEENDMKYFDAHVPKQWEHWEDADHPW
ncbi:hypothetical protein EV127DRAFT_488543 [Xylaria flabelliformis]|nr:hypothetical protein EV127DRAFT_488543 [Xylaria flabelliformis]